GARHHPRCRGRLRTLAQAAGRPGARPTARRHCRLDGEAPRAARKRRTGARHRASGVVDADPRRGAVRPRRRPAADHRQPAPHQRKPARLQRERQALSRCAVRRAAAARQSDGDGAMRRRTVLLAAALSAFALAGCGLTRPAVEIHTYLVVAGAPQGNKAASPLRIRVTPFDIAPQYEGKPLIYRFSDARFEADFYNEFLVSPRLMLQQQTAEWLRAAGHDASTA